MKNLTKVIAAAVVALVLGAAGVTSANVGCDDVCVKYRYRPGCVCCDDGCTPAVKMVLAVPDPCCCTGCPINVPVCVPACCVDAPCVSTSCGLFKGHVTYKWSCGYELRVDIGKKTGNVVVTYFGL